MSTIFVPSKINVGFQKRQGTYTGKLAYVIYYDGKGKLRKETSWNNWRDHEIANEEYENIPMSGFVLNKKAGDYNSGWNHRKAYCRVYDPRGFEFEIDIENLLYILENANCIKGKGLEGEFVYGWSGSDLVLLPTESPDYKEITAYNNMLNSTEKIKAKDLVVGATYVFKDNTEYVYLGKHMCYDECYIFTYDDDMKETEQSQYLRYNDRKYTFIRSGRQLGNRFFFGDLDGSDFSVRTTTSISGRIIGCKDPDKSPILGDLLYRLEFRSEKSPIDMSKSKLVPYTREQFNKLLPATDGERIDLKVYSDTGVMYRLARNQRYKENIKYNPGVQICEARSMYKGSLDNGRCDYIAVQDIKQRFPKDKLTNNIYSMHTVDIEPIEQDKLYDILKPCYLEVYLENGNLLTKDCWYKKLDKEEELVQV